MKRESFRIRKLIRKWDRKTGKFHIDIRYKTKITPRTIGVAESFGLGVDEYREHVIYDNVTIKISPRDIVLITGESGSGKSVMLKALEKDLGAEAVNIEDVRLDPSKPLVDTLGTSLNEAWSSSAEWVSMMLIYSSAATISSRMDRNTVTAWQNFWSLENSFG